MTELLKISLPDGSVREIEPGSTPADVAAAIGPGLAKAALAARVDAILSRGSSEVTVKVPHSAGEALSWLYRHGDVKTREETDDGCALTVRLKAADLGRLQKFDGIELSERV